MIYAQIKNSAVKNVIVLDDETLTDVFSQNFDFFIRIDELNPMPCIGWSYDGDIFTLPSIEE